MKTALLVDLDGTLVSTNSFTRFVGWLAWRLMFKGHLASAMKVVGTVVCRKVRCIPHAQAKRMIMDIARHHLSMRDFATFASALRLSVRPAIAAMIRDYKSFGGCVLIATAAPEEYAVCVGEMVGADAVIATRHADSVECRGEEKLCRVRVYCAGHRLKVDTVVTDHHDDLPLLMMPDVNRVVVAPSAVTVRRLEEAGVTYRRMF